MNPKTLKKRRIALVKTNFFGNLFLEAGGWLAFCTLCMVLATLSAPAAEPPVQATADPASDMRMLWTHKGTGKAWAAPKPDLQSESGMLQVHTDTSSAGWPGLASVSALLPGGQVMARQMVARGDSVQIDTRTWPDGPYEIAIRTEAPEGYPVIAHLPGYKGDWRAHLAALLSEADRTNARSAAQADLRLQVVASIVRAILSGEGSDTDDAEGWRKLHSMLMEHGETRQGNRGGIFADGFVRLAWRDPVDDSPQYARAYLPPDYSEDRDWPMVVRLHGYNALNPEYPGWWGVRNRHSTQAQRFGVIWLEPHGRGNTGYTGIGDADVIRAISEAKTVLRVDENRVYLSGTSMGGGGTWHVATRHPEIFAAIAPIYGGWDYRARMDAAQYQGLSVVARFFEERQSSFAQAEALQTTPVFINHGDQDDLVDVAHSRFAVRMLQRWGYDIRYREHPGQGHRSAGWDETIIPWLLSHQRVAFPRAVRIRAADLKTAQAHWVRVTQMANPLAFANAYAEVVDSQTVHLNTENVIEVVLSPGKMPVADRARVIWNDRDWGTHHFGASEVVIRAEGYHRQLADKRPDRAGPVEDAYTTPFALVIGTIAKDPMMQRFCRLQAERARDGWLEWQKANPRVFKDTEMTDAQIRAYSLILFGGPGENAVAKKLAKYLGLETGKGRVVIDGHRFDVQNASIALVRPHPYNPDRYVVVQTGNSPTGMYYAGHMPEHFDFAVSEPHVTGPEMRFEDACVVAGRFDASWRYREAFAIRGEPERRATAPLRAAPKYLNARVDAPMLMLSEVLEDGAEGSFGHMMRDLNWRGRPIRMGDQTFKKGIGVAVWHAPCKARYDLSGNGWTRLRATIGIEVDTRPEDLEPRQKEGTKVFFIVRGDGTELYRSPTFTWDSSPEEIDLNISGVEMLELEVGNEMSWHNAASSVNWANLRLERR